MKLISGFCICIAVLSCRMRSCPAPLSRKRRTIAQVMQRVDHVEHDIMLLQRQLARGGTFCAGDHRCRCAPPADAAAAGSASQRHRRSELRELRGKNEENEFQIKKLSEALDKLQRDTDFRFGERKLSASKPVPARRTNPAMPLPGQNRQLKQPAAPPAEAAADKPAMPGTPPTEAAAPEARQPPAKAEPAKGTDEIAPPARALQLRVPPAEPDAV